jgi:anti-sigma factor RsiW
VNRIRSLRAAIKANLPPSEPSSALRDEVRRLIRAQAGDRTPVVPLRLPRTPLSWPAAAAAVAIFAVGAALGYAGRGAGERDAMITQALANHVRSLEVDHLVDVTSSEHHVVKPWFIGKLDFSPPVPDLAADSFPLIGARLDYLGGRQVAALVYGRSAHRINLLVWPSGDRPRCDIEPLRARQGFNLVRGHAGTMEFWAVSDLNRQDLGRFADRWQRAASAEGESCRPEGP